MAPHALAMAKSSSRGWLTISRRGSGAGSSIQSTKSDLVAGGVRSVRRKDLLQGRPYMTWRYFETRMDQLAVTVPALIERAQSQAIVA